MAINIFWCCIEDEWMLAEKPFNVSKNFYENFYIDKNNSYTYINKCPVVNDEIKNIFGVRSIYDYEFYIKDNNVWSEKYDQSFFDNHVVIRSIDEKFFSFMQRYIFYTDQPSLKISAHIYPFFEDNNITDRCKLIPGSFDIGKWYRNLEFPFILKNNFQSFKVEKGETLYYIKFHTNEKINFIQYRFSDTLQNYREDYSKVNNLKFFNKMDDFYKTAKNKKLIIKEIKKNILE